GWPTLTKTTRTHFQETTLADKRQVLNLFMPLALCPMSALRVEPSFWRCFYVALPVSRTGPAVAALSGAVPVAAALAVHRLPTWLPKLSGWFAPCVAAWAAPRPPSDT